MLFCGQKTITGKFWFRCNPFIFGVSFDLSELSNAPNQFRDQSRSFQHSTTRAAPHYLCPSAVFGNRDASEPPLLSGGESLFQCPRRIYTKLLKRLRRRFSALDLFSGFTPFEVRVFFSGFFPPHISFLLVFFRSWQFIVMLFDGKSFVSIFKWRANTNLIHMFSESGFFFFFFQIGLQGCLLTSNDGYKQSPTTTLEQTWNCPWCY